MGKFRKIIAGTFGGVLGGGLGGFLAMLYQKPPAEFLVPFTAPLTPLIGAMIGGGMAFGFCLAYEVKDSKVRKVMLASICSGITSFTVFFLVGTANLIWLMVKIPAAEHYKHYIGYVFLESCRIAIWGGLLGLAISIPNEFLKTKMKSISLKLAKFIVVIFSATFIGFLSDFLFNLGNGLLFSFINGFTALGIVLGYIMKNGE